MKRFWLAMAAASAMLATQTAGAQEDPVRAGVEAYERGDYRQAVDMWRAPAGRGNADAQFNLGQAYRTGRGVSADRTQAESWFRKAALQGHEQAEANYGLALFENGKRADAVPWLNRAVARGDARAQYILGVMLFNGDAVPKDWVRAYALMVRSSQSGLEVATKTRAQMDQYVPLGNRQEGLSLAKKYEEEAKRGGTPLPPVDVASLPSPAPARPAAPGAAKPAATRPPAPASTTPPAAARSGAWRVQLGAFGDPANARKLWGQVAPRFPGRQPYYAKAGTLTKLLVGPYATRTEAAAACKAVAPCVPVAN